MERVYESCKPTRYICKACKLPLVLNKEGICYECSIKV